MGYSPNPAVVIGIQITKSPPSIRIEVFESIQGSEKKISIFHSRPNVAARINQDLIKPARS